MKKMSHKISSNTIMGTYPDTYLAHLKAIEIELSEAKRRRLYGWVKKRCKDLKSYLDDPHLPSNLESLVHELIGRFCKTN
ncbi:MAG: hypothetical protein GSR85_01535 [Desulfurococcales archaeon]|nr:hypothetical protein [Desulfurococcales archaeon]